MYLYLIRHANAAPLGSDGVADDAARALTGTGHAQARTLAAALQKRGIRFDAVVTSPLLRAKQTADDLLEHWQADKPILHVFEEIGFEVRPRRIVKFLRKLGANSVAIVGHQPGLSRFAAWLFGSKKAKLDLAKAGVACISCDEWAKRAGTLEWLVAPEWYS